MLNQAYISLGGNLGNTEHIFVEALQLIELRIGNIILKSSLFQTAAWGNAEQDDFLNQVILLETNLNPQNLLDNLLTIELHFKRERIVHWGPRTLDLDILYFNQEIIQTENLTVPHPRIKERRFILIPMHEISPYWIDPASSKPIAELLETCPDKLPVKKLN